jgi:low temperature requirement protein LtrA
MPLFRTRGHHAPVTPVELFFDLVFVFAITQLSHTLLAHPSPLGALQVLMLFLAVWWSWINTAWVTNWLDPERTPVRLMLFALMLAGLLLSTSLPEAFGERGLVFAAAHAAMQVGRPGFVLWAARRDHHPAQQRNFTRILSWAGFSALFWLAGGLAEGGWRLGLWAVALLADNTGPLLRYWLPRLGGSPIRDWDVAGAHMAERCGLFIIIALGESILVTGATLAEHPLAWDIAAAFLIAFIGSVAMWWIYFDTGAERGADHIAAAADPGRLARAGYTYLHMPIVAGIVVGAVGDELVLAHPTGHAGLPMACTVLGGAGLFLLGNLLFKWMVAGRAPLSHLVGMGLMALLAIPAAGLSPLLLALGSAAILVLTAGWETWSLRRGSTQKSGGTHKGAAAS